MEESRQKIAELFNAMQENDLTVTNKHLYAIIDEFGQDIDGSIEGLEQCFLYIMKTLADAKKKSTKFDKFSEKFFSLLHLTCLNHKATTQQKVNKSTPPSAAEAYSNENHSFRLWATN